MQFLKTLLIVFTVALAVGFAYNNWDIVSIKLWSGLLLDINLPLLLLVCFLAGMIPTWLWQRAIRWRLSQRLATSERAVSDLRTVIAQPASITAAADVEPIAAPITPSPIEEPRA